MALAGTNHRSTLFGLELRARIRGRLRDGRDGRALIDELERGAEAVPPGADRSQLYADLGQVAEELVPERARALGLYRRAWEEDRTNQVAAQAAIGLCREVGRLDDLVFIAGWELETESDPARQAELTALIAEALLDLGERQRAASLLVSAVGLHPESQAIQDGLATIGYDDDWRPEARRLAALAEEPDAVDGARLCLRAARIFRMEAPEDPEYESLLRRAIAHDPQCESAHYLLEALLGEAGRTEDLLAHQWKRVESVNELRDSADLCLHYAFAWSERFRDRERAAAWVLRAVELGQLFFPVAGLTLLRDFHAGRREWGPLLEAIDEVLALALDEDSEVHAALLGGTVAWKALGDLERARGYFDRVRELAEGSLLVGEFDDNVAQTLRPDPISDAQRALMQAAQKIPFAEQPDRAIDAWRKAVALDPARRTPRRGLARVLRRTERWRALVDALKEEEAHAAPSDEDRVAVLLELAGVYRDRLHHDHLVATTLQRIIELSPANLPALDQLAAHFAAMRRWPEVVQTLQRRIQATPEPAAQAALWRRIAEVQVEKLASEADAVKSLEAALALDDQDQGAAFQLEHFYEKRRDYEKLIGLKLRRAKAIAHPRARATALVDVARQATEKLKRLQPAIDAWRAVIDAGPAAHQEDEALAALEKLYTREQDWARLGEVYGGQAARAADPQTKAARFQEIALLYSTRLDDTDRAAQAWREVLALDPRHLRAQDALRRILLQRGAWGELVALFEQIGKLEECVRVLERQVELSELDPPARVEVWTRIGMIQRDALARPDRALRAFERVLELDPHHRAAAEALIPFYERDPSKLAAVLAIELEHVRDAEGRRTRLRRLAALHETALGDLPAALSWWLRAFAEEPTAEDARAAVPRLAQATSAWNGLLDAYRLAAQALEPAVALPLFVECARVEEGPLQRADLALETWQKILALDDRHTEALTALERLYFAAQRWEELQTIYVRQLGLAADEPQRRQVQYKIAHLAEARGDDGRAAAAYRAILEAGGDEPAELEALARIYERQGAAPELADVLGRELALLAPEAHEARRPLQLRLAALREERLADAAGAIALYQAVLEAAPEDEPARTALEKRLGDPDHELVAARILDPIYQRAGAFARLVTAREVMVAHEQGAAAVELLHGIAELCEQRLGRPDAAIVALGRALRIDPSSARTFTELDRLAVATGSWTTQLALYKEVASRPLGLGEQVSLRCRIGRVYRHMGEIERALATYTRVLDLAADHVEAAAALAELYRETGRFAELASLLKRQIEHAGDPAPLATLERLGEVLERHVGDLAGAMEIYRQILARDMRHAPTLAALDRLLRGGTIPADMPPGERLLVHLRMGELHEQLGDRDRAEASFRDALALLGAGGPAVTDPAMQLKLARLERDLAGDHEQARALFRAVLAGDPGSEAALRELARLESGESADGLWARLLELDGGDVEALAQLARSYEAAGRFAELAEVVRRQLAATPPSVEAILPLLTKLARLYGEQLGDEVQARAAFEEALTLAPDDLETLRPLAALERASQRFSELAATLARIAERAEPREAAATWAELGALESDVLGRDERALSAWRRLRELDPSSSKALEALEALYARTGQPRLQIDVLERRAALAEDPHAKLTLALEAGTLWLELDEPARACEWYERVRAAEPAHPVASAQLESLYRDAADWRRVVAILADRVRSTEDPQVQVALLAQISRLQEIELRDPEAAFVTLLDALAVDRRYEPLADDLERLAKAHGRMSALAEAVELHAAAEPERGHRLELYLIVGDLREREPGEALAAINAYRSALDVDAGSTLALDALERLYRRESLAGPLATVLERKAQLTLDSDDQLHLFSEVADLCEGAAKWDRAVEARKRCAEIEPSPEGRGKQLLAAGRLLRDRIKDTDGALVCFDQALDACVSESDAPAPWTEILAAIDAIAAERADWRLLERSYRRILDRLPQKPGDRAVAVLWQNLGELYRSRLADAPAAARAFEIAASLTMT